MKINLGFAGLEYKDGHRVYWVRKPKGFTVTSYYARHRGMTFAGLSFVYALKVWDFKPSWGGKWHKPWQDKFVPILGTWADRINSAHLDSNLLQILLWKFKFYG